MWFYGPAVHNTNMRQMAAKRPPWDPHRGTYQHLSTEGEADLAEESGMGLGYRTRQENSASSAAPRTAASCLLPKLTNTEEQFFKLVQGGSVTQVDVFLKNCPNFNLNCQNYRGYTALTLSVLEADIDTASYLLQLRGIRLGDSYFYAVKAGNVNILEMLLNHRRQMSKHGLVEDESAMTPSRANPDFSTDLTLLILAAVLNNYDIINLLLNRGHVIKKPHHPDCFCKEKCESRVMGESLDDSLARYNAFKALCSSAYISQTSDDPILTAFSISMELQNCANVEKELKLQFLHLSKQVSKFAVDLLARCRTTTEVELILNHAEGAAVSKSLHRYHRVSLAIDTEQKSFIAHPNCQQVLRTAWLEGWHDWKRLNLLTKVARLLPRMFLLPLMAMVYWVIPNSNLVQDWKAPLNKFFSFGASFGLFLIVVLVQIGLDNENSVRGPPATGLEFVLVFYVFGLFWRNLKTLSNHGVKQYVNHPWNLYDLVMCLLFMATFLMWILSVVDITLNGNLDVPRYKWDEHDAVLIAEALYCWAIIFAFGKLVYFFQIGHELGSLQVSIIWMMRDIIKFMVTFAVIMVSFAVGLHMLYHHYQGLVGTYHGQPQVQERAFTTFLETLKTLYWSIYGYSPPYFADIVQMDYDEVGPDGNTTIHISRHHGFTQTVGQFVFALYYVVGIIIMFNMLIAMMSTSFSAVQSNADTEWKFARTKVWMSFMEDGNTLPPPFNIIPTPKAFCHICAWFGKKLSQDDNTDCSVTKCCYIAKKEKEDTQEKEKYKFLMATLIQRYLAVTRITHEKYRPGYVKQGSSSAASDTRNSSNQANVSDS